MTTKTFLSQFGLDTLRQLPALEYAGLLSKEKLLAEDIPIGLSRGKRRRRGRANDRRR
ncbi:hypothetical protein NKG60_23250 [Mesorhizobium sp. M1428]|uniref:hypothetical protein n=1 Tax=unclassified Mesorhizobium TaxID=325217 RepID=UPI003336498D